MARRSVKTMPLGEYSGITLRRQRVQNLLLTENRFPPSLDIEEHSHSYPHFTIMLAGSFVERYGDQEFVCERGAILIVPENQPHTDTIGTAGAHSLSIEISRSLVNFLLSESNLLARPNVFDHPSLKLPILNLKKLFIDCSFPSPFELHSAAMQVILAMFRIANSPPEYANNCPGWLSEVVSIIESDPGQTPAITELAKTAKVSPEHLSRAFRRHIRQTFSDFVRSARLRKAIQELKTTNVSIATIAADNGFFDQAHFCREFKRVYGVTPSAYRTNII